MSGWTIAWLLWLGAFAVIEGMALRNRRRNDTLSEHVWRWFAVKSEGKWGQARRAALLMFMAWLAAHFLTGGLF